MEEVQRPIATLTAALLEEQPSNTTMSLQLLRLKGLQRTLLQNAAATQQTLHQQASNAKRLDLKRCNLQYQQQVNEQRAVVSSSNGDGSSSYLERLAASIVGDGDDGIIEKTSIASYFGFVWLRSRSLNRGDREHHAARISRHQ